MSSYYAAERLTLNLIKRILRFIKTSSDPCVANIYGKTIGDLAPHYQKALLKKGGKKELQRVIYYLDRRGFIEKIGRGDDAILQLTNKGLKRLDKLEFEEIKTEKWDGWWRVLTFDIPENNRLARDAVRRLIKQLGFAYLHKSVWIIPYSCEKQITQIQEAYGIDDHLTLLKVKTFDNEDKFKKKFNL